MTEKKTLPPDDTPSVPPVPEALPSPGPAAAEAKPDSAGPAVHGESAPASEPDPEETKHFKSKLKKKEGELRQLKKERDDLHDQLLRRLADMDNLKKRLDREKSDYLQYALTEFIKTVLPILDNLERALDRADEGDASGLPEGLRLIQKQFVDTLGKHGVSAIPDVVHHKFDPNLHHALATEESDEVEEPQVVEEMQKGYTLHDRLLRPALVKVRLPRKTNA